MDTTIKKSTYLSTAIAHLLSIISNEATKVAGHARAVRSELNTVSMAPSFINWIAITTILTTKYLQFEYVKSIIITQAYIRGSKKLREVSQSWMAVLSAIKFLDSYWSTYLYTQVVSIKEMLM